MLGFQPRQDKTVDFVPDPAGVPDLRRHRTPGNLECPVIPARTLLGGAFFGPYSAFIDPSADQIDLLIGKPATGWHLQVRRLLDGLDDQAFARGARLERRSAIAAGQNRFTAIER